MKPYRATITLTYLAADDREADEYLGYARLGATGAISVARAPVFEKGEAKALDPTKMPKDSVTRQQWEELQPPERAS